MLVYLLYVIEIKSVIYLSYLLNNVIPFFNLIYIYFFYEYCVDISEIFIGTVADILLWKKWTGGVILLVVATVFWLLFERAGYNLLQFISNVLLLLVAILFFWAKSASILNRYFRSVI